MQSANLLLVLSSPWIGIATATGDIAYWVWLASCRQPTRKE